PDTAERCSAYSWAHMRLKTPPAGQAWQAPARHTESKRPLVVLFTTAREMTQITSRLPSRILSELNVKITAARADQRPLWQVT
ncbi:hypothetical protein A5N45_14330, partial [Streptococcus pneumoniae]